MQFLIILSLVFLTSLSPSLAQELNEKQLKQTIADLAKAKDVYEQLDPTLIGAQYLAYSKSSSSYGALADLWRTNKRTYVELSWYKQQNHQSRLLALLLFYTQKKSTTSQFPDFTEAARRYGKNERVKRLAEIKYVSSHHSEYKPLIDNMLQRRHEAATRILEKP